MTPAITQLQQLGIDFKIHQYHHDPKHHSYGLEAAEKMQVPANRVFKTLVIEQADSSLAVVILPVEQNCSLKLAAKNLKTKKAAMASPTRVQASTGYVLGGVSPIGQTRKLPTLIDASAEQFETIFVSAGKRGLEIELSPHALADICKARFTPITQLQS